MSGNEEILNADDLTSDILDISDLDNIDSADLINIDGVEDIDFQLDDIDIDLESDLDKELDVNFNQNIDDLSEDVTSSLDKALDDSMGLNSLIESEIKSIDQDALKNKLDGESESINSQEIAPEVKESVSDEKNESESLGKEEALNDDVEEDDLDFLLGDSENTAELRGEENVIHNDSEKNDDSDVSGDNSDSEHYVETSKEVNSPESSNVDKEAKLIDEQENKTKNDVKDKNMSKNTFLVKIAVVAISFILVVVLGYFAWDKYGHMLNSQPEKIPQEMHQMMEASAQLDNGVIGEETSVDGFPEIINESDYVEEVSRDNESLLEGHDELALVDSSESFVPEGIEVSAPLEKSIEDQDDKLDSINTKFEKMMSLIENQSAQINSLKDMVYSKDKEISKLAKEVKTLKHKEYSVSKSNGSKKEISRLNVKIKKLEREMLKSQKSTHDAVAKMNNRPVFPGWKMAAIAPNRIIMSNGHEYKTLKAGDYLLGIKIVKIYPEKGKAVTTAGDVFYE